MGTINIKLDAVLAQSRDLSNARQTVADVKSSVDSLYRQIDSRILNRNNIGTRMRNAFNQMNGIQDKVGRIKSTVESGVNSYYTADMKAVHEARKITDHNCRQ